MAHKFSLKEPSEFIFNFVSPWKEIDSDFFEEGAKLKILSEIELSLLKYLTINMNIMNYVFIYLEIYCCLKKLIDLESVVSFLMPRFMKLFWFLVVQVLISYVFFCLFFFFTTKKSCLKAWNINQTFSHIFFGYKKSQNPKLCYSLDY